MQSLKAYSNRSILMDQYLKFSATLQKTQRSYRLPITLMNFWEKLMMSVAIIISLVSTNTIEQKLLPILSQIIYFFV